MAHQLALIIDCSIGTVKNEVYWERVSRALQSVNKPDTIKASVYMVTDKVVKIVEPGQSFASPASWLPYGTVFNPYTESVASAIKMGGHNTVAVISPASDFLAKCEGNNTPEPVSEVVYAEKNPNIDMVNQDNLVAASFNDAYYKAYKAKGAYEMTADEMVNLYYDSTYNSTTMVKSLPVDPDLQQLLDEEVLIKELIGDEE
jgi:hypothetical protein